MIKTENHNFLDGYKIQKVFDDQYPELYFLIFKNQRNEIKYQPCCDNDNVFISTNMLDATTRLLDYVRDVLNHTIDF